MTNPTLERAARAVMEAVEKATNPNTFDVEIARAVLMAVLPTLPRWHRVVDEMWDDSDGEWVEWDDLQAILNDGEGK